MPRRRKVRRAMLAIVLLVRILFGAANAAEPAKLAKSPQAQATAHRGRIGTLPAAAAKLDDYLTAEQLAQLGPISYSAINAPLRQALRNFSQALRVAIVVDRRVDPDQVVNIDLADVPLPEALQVVAERSGGGASVLGPVIYIGPSETAQQLRTLAALATQDVQKLPTRLKSAALLSRPLSWQALATPQQVFERLARSRPTDRRPGAAAARFAGSHRLATAAVDRSRDADRGAIRPDAQDRRGEPFAGIGADRKKRADRSAAIRLAASRPRPWPNGRSGPPPPRSNCRAGTSWSAPRSRIMNGCRRRGPHARPAWRPASRSTR